MVANSNAMNGIAAGSEIHYSLAPWQVGNMIFIVVTAVLFLAAIGMTVYKVQDKKKNPEKYN